jgi:hypothetical protein
MTLRRSLFVALWIAVHVACGGQSEQSLPSSAAAGAATAAAGHPSTVGPIGSSGGRAGSSGGAVGSSGGVSSGGVSSGGVSNGGTAGLNSSMSGGGPLQLGCCGAIRGCPIGETQIFGANVCVSPDTCHQMTSCCGQGAACCVTFWCDLIPDAGASEAGASNAGASASDAGAGGVAGDHQ